MQFETKNWSAHRWSKDFAGDGSVLVVTGEVQTTNSNQIPTLTKAEPQGINPAILLLTLKVNAADAGLDVMEWKRVGYWQSEDADSHDSVTVNGDCKPVSVPVIDIPS